MEVRWLQKLADCDAIKEVPLFDDHANGYLDTIVVNFSVAYAVHIKIIERTTNHDAYTSEDINNLSHSLMLATVRETNLL